VFTWEKRGDLKGEEADSVTQKGRRGGEGVARGRGSVKKNPEKKKKKVGGKGVRNRVGVIRGERVGEYCANKRKAKVVRLRRHWKESG